MQRRCRARGVVQGVGFRPFVWHLARELNLTGWVRNDAAGVEILVEGDAPQVEAFTRRLPREIPPLARLDAFTWEDAIADSGQREFLILESGAGEAATMIGADTAVCPDCLAEMFDAKDRRWRYAFINCTHCGPRYTLTRRLPYDRAQTSMAAFPLCAACNQEYRDPANRRFHAEPTACPVCGPRLEWVEAPDSPPFKGGVGGGMGLEKPIPTPALPLKGREFQPIPTPARRRALHCTSVPAATSDARRNPACTPLKGREFDPIAAALAALQSGQIVALKGLGGFHLACIARDAAAVQRLRQRKNREEKPFALMAANLASVADYVEWDAAEAALVQSPERPIVLLRKKPAADRAFPDIAPGLAWLGVMLPYTPQHWLLFHEAAGRPQGVAWMEQAQELVLVMTSANPGGEPLVIHNQEARERLAGIADALLLHDRDIVVRCDDSVMRQMDAVPQFIRRARGYTPRAIRLPAIQLPAIQLPAIQLPTIQLPNAGPSVLALGGYLKNTLCVTRGDEAFLSQHIGGLDNPATCEMLMEVAEHLLHILRVRPVAVAHDLHPDFFSTRHAQELAGQWGVPAIAVQHHHAHIAAVAAEHGVMEPLLGLALDGVGLGPDGGAWGGELLRVEGASFTRLGHLAPLPMPGGDRAAKEPWRMAAAALHRLGRGAEIPGRFAAQAQAGNVARLLARNPIPTPALPLKGRELNPIPTDPLLPPTTSLGRCFDAAAGLLGVREVMAYEGQAAMLLEGLAELAGPVPPLANGYVLDDQGGLDLLPLLDRLADESNLPRGAALFHATLALALADWTEQNAQRQGLSLVALGGGCFLNHLLSRDLTRHLAARGLRVLTARQAPPNDGGLSLGQAWVAMQQTF